MAAPPILPPASPPLDGGAAQGAAGLRRPLVARNARSNFYGPSKFGNGHSVASGGRRPARRAACAQPQAARLQSAAMQGATCRRRATSACPHGHWTDTAILYQEVLIIYLSIYLILNDFWSERRDLNSGPPVPQTLQFVCRCSIRVRISRIKSPKILVVDRKTLSQCDHTEDGHRHGVRFSPDTRRTWRGGRGMSS